MTRARRWGAPRSGQGGWLSVRVEGARAMSREPVIITHADTRLHEAFLRFVPRVFPRASFRKWHELGGWDETYRAVAIVEDGEIVANASLTRMRLVLEGRELTGWQLGAVGVVPGRRGEGLQRLILPRLLELSAPDDLVFLFANDSVLDFYPRFGFRRVGEAVFGVDCAVTPSGRPLRRLSVDAADDRATVRRVAAAALPVTQRFGARDYGGIVLWYWTNFFGDNLCYCEDVDAVLVVQQEGDTLRICDVLAQEPFDLRAYLPRLATSPVRRLELGFTPETWWPRARALAEHRGSPLFLRGPHRLPDAPFKFPMLAQT